jgi:multidrug efflux pump subunit AcrA (membrane-fusion protein)
MEGYKNTDLRTEEVRDILRRMPHWTIRWGTTVIAAAIVVLLIFSFLFRYPDMITSEVVISASNPPAEIKARSTGKITGIYIANEENVHKGQTLAVIENPAKLEDMEQVKAYVAEMKPFISSPDLSLEVKAPSSLVLGQVQESFSSFLKQLADYQNFILQKFYAERITALEGQIAMQQQMLIRLEAQQKIEEQRFRLSTQSYQRDSSLFEKKAISEEEFDQSKSSFLSQKRNLEDICSQQVTTRSGIYDLQQQKATLEQDNDTKLKEYTTSLTQAYSLLGTAIDNWFLAYVLTSPIDGKASFNKIWALNQNITEGETLLTIVPDTPSCLVGKAYIPVEGAGKVKPGQRVNIKLSNYPYLEYGMIIGKVTQKAPVPVNNLYAVEIGLSQKLTTNYGKTLDMQQELHGNSEIITDDLRLIERIIYPVKMVIEKNRR